MTPTDTERHEFFMRRALELAGCARGDTHPNPMVGAVIVEDGRIVAEGFHARAGEPHAEPCAIRALGRKPKPGATLYVTLEPCCTHGRTPPCTEAIKAAGFARVVVGATDPNPAHAGHGYAVLREAGVEVVTGVLANECSDLNLLFNHTITTGSPFFAMKVATTLDGRTATRTGESQWITGAESRAEVMRLRRLYPAIAAGAGTVLADDPKLTARLPEGERCPVRFVLDRSGRLAGCGALSVFADEHAARTVLLLGERAGAGVAKAFERRGVNVCILPDKLPGDFLSAFKSHCRRGKISGVLFEPGASLAGALIEHRAADYLYHFTAPMLFADNAARAFADGPARPALGDAVRLREVRRSAHGEDLLTRGHLVYP